MKAHFSSKNRGQGFSLIELMTCIAILTTGLIFIVEIFSTMLNTSSKGADWSVGTFLAAAALDQLLYDPVQLNYAFQNASSGIFTPAPYTYQPGSSEPAGVASVNHITYNYTYTLGTVTSSGSPITRGLYQVDVQVSWYAPLSSQQAGNAPRGYGKLTTHLSRLIYVH